MKAASDSSLSIVSGERVRSSLVSKNVTILGRRTSIRLEPEMWVALVDIAKREQCSVHDLCTLVYIRKEDTTSLTAAIRVFLMLYFRAASTEQGHAAAGHGNFFEMKKRAGIPGSFDSFSRPEEKKPAYQFDKEKVKNTA